MSGLDDLLGSLTKSAGGSGQGGGGLEDLLGGLLGGGSSGGSGRAAGADCRTSSAAFSEAAPVGAPAPRRAA